MRHPTPLLWEDRRQKEYRVQRARFFRLLAVFIFILLAIFIQLTFTTIQ